MASADPFSSGVAFDGWKERANELFVPEDEFHREYNTNVLGLLLATQEAVKHFGPEGGSVINIGSNASQLSPPTSAVYTATKGAVDSVTHVLAKELGARKIRVNTIAPGLFDTPLLAALPEEARQKLGAGVPFPQRLGRPEEYAQLTCQVVENRMLNGETIRLDGALRMPPR